MSSKTKTTATMEEAKPVLVPKLRFPEFREKAAWKSKLLGSLFSQREETGRTTLRLLSLMDKEGIIPQENSNRKNNASGDLSKYLRVVPGDIAYNTMRMWEGRSALSKLEGIVSPAYTICCPGPETNSLFFSYYFKTPQLIGEFARYSQGLVKDTLNLKFDAFARIPAATPSDPAEQQKIAECLSSVDKLMAAQARKVDALKTHKKGLMQQLFPREGETQARLRFPEFQNAGEWKDDQLGAVCELYQPVTLSSSELSMTGEYLVYGANGVIGTHNEYNHEQSEIAVTCRGATCGEVTTTKPKSWITGNAMVVRPRNKKLRKDFIFHYFKNHGLKHVISGSAQPQITRTGFAPLVIFSPDPDEQQRIATCLSSLDALITAETQKQEALKTHKKGLMQQLFPSPEEVEA
jgi:type I restriction enzyme S subunit